MKCVVVDDEQPAVEVLTRYIEKHTSLQLSAAFIDAVAAVDFLSRHHVDLMFLDINMPDLNGMQLLNSLERKPMVIFTTAYSEYAVQSYDYSAIDYLLKPITFDRFIKSVNKAQSLLSLSTATSPSPTKISAESITLKIKSGNSTHFIPENTISYVEGAGNYVVIFTKTEKIMSLMSMNRIEELLSTGNFIRIHKSYIVSLAQVRKTDRASLTVGDTELPIGNTYRERVFRALQK